MASPMLFGDKLVTIVVLVSIGAVLSGIVVSSLIDLSSTEIALGGLFFVVAPIVFSVFMFKIYTQSLR